jgi:hypothetical protein
MSGMGMYQRFQAMRQMGDAGMFHPDAQIQVQKERSKRGMEDKKAAEEKKKKMRKEAKAQKKKNRR